MGCQLFRSATRSARKMLALRDRWPRRVRLVLLAIMFGGLTVASLEPRLAPSAEHGFDLGVHTVVYALVTVVTVLLAGRPAISAAFVLALSGALEFLQNFSPGRFGSLDDMAANAAGVGIALAAIIVLGLLGLPIAKEGTADPNGAG